jgi:3-dehydroquinate synthase
VNVSIKVPLPEREYNIEIGQDLLSTSSDYIFPLLRRQKVVIVTDENVAALHLETLENSLDAAKIFHSTLTLPPGEATKSWTYLQKTVDFLLEEKTERADIIIALGGGVIGDLVGFAAAILRRGVSFVQIPTSLLAQVDSSVGGKTGINTSQGKNLVGAFHQPSLVLSDVEVLNTLQKRDFMSGYGEVVKYGLLGSEDFFVWLEKNGSALVTGDITARLEAVRMSCQIKVDIVAKDETEQGDRALLNLGHTFSHALEAATGYSNRLMHGEGVAIGCVLAFELSARLGLCPQEAPSRVRAHLQKMGMKTEIADIKGSLPAAAELLLIMAQDKKVVGGKLNFVLVNDIGKSFMTSDIDKDTILSVLHDSAQSKPSRHSF